MKQKRSSLNARKHGLTSRVVTSSKSHLARLKLVEALSQGNSNPDVLSAAGQLADLQATIALILTRKGIAYKIVQCLRHAVAKQPMMPWKLTKTEGQWK